MLKPLIVKENWDGGMSLNDRLAKKNQVTRGSGVEQFLRPGYLANKVGLTRHTLSGNTDLGVEFQDILFTQKNSVLYYAGEDTKIYTGSGALSVANDSDQAGIIRSLKEYKGYMYYTQDTTIGRSDLAGSPTYTNNWQDSDISNVAYKPQVISGDNSSTGSSLFIGNGQYVAKWDNTTFTYNALDLKTGTEIQCMDNFSAGLLAIGANYGTSENSVASKIYLWNKVHPTIWDDEIEVPETKIHAMISRPGGLWYFAGTNSLSLYFCPLGSRQSINVHTFENELPGSLFEPTVYPNAITVKDGRIFFGLSFSTIISNQFLPGIYSFNPDINNFKMVCERATKNIGLTDFKSIKAVKDTNQPQIIYFSTENSTTQNLYRENLFSSDTSIYGTSGSFSIGEVETEYFEAPVGKKLYFDGFGLDYLPLKGIAPTVELYYMKDTETGYTLIESTSTTGVTGFYKTLPVECCSIKFKIVISVLDARNFIKRFYGTGKLMEDTR